MILIATPGCSLSSLRPSSLSFRESVSSSPGLIRKRSGTLMMQWGQIDELIPSETVPMQSLMGQPIRTDALPAPLTANLGNTEIPGRVDIRRSNGEHAGGGT